MESRQTIRRGRPAAGGWRAPSLEDFGAMAEAAFAGLPEAFRAMVGEVTFAVAEFPDEEVLESLGAESPFDILGLFEGVGMAQGEAVPQTGSMPNRIWLYRRPILDYWAENDESLEDIVTHVLVHEIGHHFGLSDDDMEAIEAAAD